LSRLKWETYLAFVKTIISGLNRTVNQPAIVLLEKTKSIFTDNKKGAIQSDAGIIILP
jgi:hypothetical protein